MGGSEVREVEGGDAEDLVEDEGVGEADLHGGNLPCPLSEVFGGQGLECDGAEVVEEFEVA
jgi:hypothetical protein